FPKIFINLKSKDMAFNGDEGEFVTLAMASDWTETYRNDHAGETKAHFFGKNKLQEILDQTGCMGIRIYYAIDGDGKKQLVLVGAGADEKDMTAGNLILDMGWPCPSFCDSDSGLNNK